uniref:Uncharacterized protein n=1 Tax=Arundo donax TaxID=35708 RepID=A0A0A8ZLH0_ARUDO
MPAQKCVESLE